MGEAATVSPIARLTSWARPARKGVPATYPTNWDTRGLRNNNPGNIEHSPATWQGQSEQQTDPRFVQFDDMAHGVRALAVTLRTYAVRHGCRTVSDYISRWAPPSENNTAAYVKAVAAALWVAPTDPIDTASWSTMRELCLAISSHENGIGTRELVQWLDFAAGLNEGVTLALGTNHG